MSTAVPAVSNGVQTHSPEASPTLLQAIIDKIKIIWNVIAMALTVFFHWLCGCFTWHSTEQKQAIQEINANKPRNFVEQLYFKELVEQIRGLKKDQSPEILLKSIDDTAALFEELSDETAISVEKLKKKIKEEEDLEPLIAEADALYKGSMERLAELKSKPGTKVQRALYSGRFTTIFKELDDAFSDKKGEMLHRYCGCHICSGHSDEALKKLAPGIKADTKGNIKFKLDAPKLDKRENYPKHVSSALMSWSLGGGHNVVQEAMSSRIAETGGHAYRIEADEEVLEAYYNARQWTGKSFVEWSQWLLQNNYFRLIRFIGWISSLTDSKSALEDKVQRFALSLLSRGEQDVVTMCFTRFTNATEKAAARLGMPMYDIATDLDYEVWMTEIENEYFRHATMAKDQELEEQQLHPVLTKDRVVNGGFPVREPFIRSYSEDELAEIRKRYNEQYGLEPDARVVVLLCGGEGVQNNFAEILAKQYHQQTNGPKIHLFAICGKNQAKKNILDAEFAKVGNRPNFKATAFGWTDPKALGELFAMGALEEKKGLLVSAKAGGGTVSEGVARGIPMLVCDMSKVVKHEGMNLKFITKHELGELFTRAVELPGKVVSMLTKDHPKSPFAGFDSKGESLRHIGDLVQKARNDEALREKLSLSFSELPKAALKSKKSEVELAQFQSIATA